MRTKVVGVTFSNEDGSSRTRIIAGMTESDKVCIERDPFNQYDANAVKVCVLKNGEKKQIGFLAKEIAAEVSPKLRKNATFNVSIAGVGIWNDRPFCEIDIMELASAPKEEVKPVTSGSSFTPSKPSGPTFSPTRPSGPAFTPSKPASPTFTPNRPSTPSSTPTSSTATVSGASQPKTTPVTSSPRPSSPTTPQNTNNSGCLGIMVGIVVVISALLML